MDRLDREKVDNWLLSGEPVVRLYGRDYDVSPKRYAEWLLEVARNYSIEVQIKTIVDPPGLVVRAYIGDEPEALRDPLLVVNKKTCPWLFCTLKSCTNRLADGMPPGATCEAHRGK